VRIPKGMRLQNALTSIAANTNRTFKRTALVGLTN